mmetsp:Transcript_26703/g.52425  ORF Transcript_26703/g.52425 Transcript_26703/m.52425 type:complete len:90 (-) Transcript_26703:726-995(-)
MEGKQTVCALSACVPASSHVPWVVPFFFPSVYYFPLAQGIAALPPYNINIYRPFRPSLASNVFGQSRHAISPSFSPVKLVLVARDKGGR